MQIAEQILQAMRKMGDKRTPIGETATHSKHVSSGEPDDAKVSSPVRRGVCGKVPEKVTRHFPTLLHHTGAHLEAHFMCQGTTAYRQTRKPPVIIDNPLSI
jgi:hypothetical protein